MTTALARMSELDRYMVEVNRHSILDSKEEYRLAKLWRDKGDVTAAHTLVTSNLRFVVKIAHEYRGYQARILDLIQEGSVGLMQAVKRFDPERGYRLISYAVFWIRSSIHTYLMSSMRMIKIGTSRAHRKLFFKLRSLKSKLAAEGMDDRDQIIDAVAKEVGVDRADVEDMDRHLTRGDASLDAPLPSTGTAMIEIIPSEEQNQEEQLAQMEMEADRAARLESALAILDDRERQVIEKRHLTDEPVQLKEIGKQMGVSKQRVSQLEKRAMKKLKYALEEAA
jgi:RNA polymerase sigma-32 factor